LQNEVGSVTVDFSIYIEEKEEEEEIANVTKVASNST